MNSMRREPPLRPAPISILRRTETTVVSYRRAVQKFLTWCALLSLCYHNEYELDDLLVEWLTMQNVSKAVFAHAIAGVELAIPTCKGQLSWSRQVLKDFEVIAPVNHHIPLPKQLALLLVLLLSHWGHGRIAAGLIVSQVLGLRPSELLKLRSNDISLPDSLAFGNENTILINLGAKTGTKVKRP